MSQSPARSATSAGLDPAQYESAGRRRDSGISRAGSVELRRALLDLGVGVWHPDPAARAYAAGLRERAKPGGIIATALARRANKIAFAMVRDQTRYEPTAYTNLPALDDPRDESRCVRTCLTGPTAS